MIFFYQAPALCRALTPKSISFAVAAPTATMQPSEKPVICTGLHPSPRPLFSLSSPPRSFPKPPANHLMSRFLHPYIAILFLGFSSIVSALAFHPADTDQDGRIDQGELVAYSKAWSQGESWSTPPGAIPESYARQAENLWRSGELYRRVPDAPLPAAWVPNPAGATFVALERNAAEPLDRLEVFGIPPEENVTLEYSFDGFPGSFLGRSFMLGGKRYVIVPVNPYLLAGGGSVRFRFIGEVESLPEWLTGPVDLQELPEASGAIVAYLDQSLAVTEAYASELGFDIATLRQTPVSDIPMEARPLALLLELANFDAGAHEAEIDEWNRLFAKAGLIQRLPTLPEAQPQMLQTSSDIFAHSSPGKRAINGPGQLAIAMTQQANAAANLASDITTTADAASQALGDAIAISDGLDMLSDALKGIAPDISPSPSAFDAIITTYQTWKFLQAYDAGTLPSQFDTMEIQLTDAAYGTLVEDGCPPRDRLLARVIVSASSTGFDYADAMGLNADQSSPLRQAWNFLQPFGVGKAVGRTLTQRAVELSNTGIPPNTWGGIQISAPEFTLTQTTAALEVTGYDSTAMAVEIGPAALGAGVITMTARGDSFAGKTITATAAYSVEPLKVTLDGPRSVIPGAIVEFRAELPNAIDQSLEAIAWDVSAGAIIGPPTKSGNQYVILWQAPADAASFPAIITATSATTLCLRGLAGAEPRFATLTVRSPELIIMPRILCISPGDSQIFTAEMSDGSITPPITWSIDSGGGSIDEHGEYTAPFNPDIVVIRAANSDDSSQFATYQFRVDCTTRASLFLPLADLPIEVGTSRGTWSVVLEPMFFPFGSGVITGGMDIEFTRVTDADDGGQRWAEGSVFGAGFEIFDVVTEPEKFSYEYTNSSGASATYTLGAKVVLGWEDEPELPGSARIAGQGDNKQLLVSFHARVDVSNRPLEHEIVSYEWTFSNGAVASGEYVEVDVGFWSEVVEATLKITDDRGNTAIGKQAISVMRIDGHVGFAFRDDGEDAYCFNFTGLSEQFCGLEFELIGGLNGTFLADTGAGSWVVEDDDEVPLYFSITFF